MLQPHLVGRAELCQIFSLERAVWGLVEEALGGGAGRLGGCISASQQGCSGRAHASNIDACSVLPFDHISCPPYLSPLFSGAVLCCLPWMDFTTFPSFLQSSSFHKVFHLGEM